MSDEAHLTWGALGRRAIVRAGATVLLATIAALCVLALQRRPSDDLAKRLIMAACLAALAGPTAVVELLQARHPRETRRDAGAVALVLVVVSVIAFYALLQAQWARIVFVDGRDREVATRTILDRVFPDMVRDLGAFALMLVGPAVPFACLAGTRLARRTLVVQTIACGLGAALVFPSFALTSSYAFRRAFEWIWSRSKLETGIAFVAFALVLPLAATLGERLDRRVFRDDEAA